MQTIQVWGCGNGKKLQISKKYIQNRKACSESTEDSDTGAGQGKQEAEGTGGQKVIPEAAFCRLGNSYDKT